MSAEYLLDDDDVIVSKSDLLGNIVSVNHTLLKVSGYNKAELIGQPHSLLRHPDVPREMFASMWETISQGYTWYGVVKNKRKNGDYYWVAANVAPIFDETDEITGYVSVRYPVTQEEKQSAQALCDAIRHGTGKLPDLSIRHFDPLFLIGMIIILIGIGVDIIAHATHTDLTMTLLGGLIAMFGLGLIFVRGIALYRPNPDQLIAIHRMSRGVFKEPVRGRDAWSNALNLLRVRIARNMAGKQESIQESAILNAAMNSATTHIMVLDKELNILSMNESLHDMFYRITPQLQTVIPDFSSDQLIGKNFDMFHINASKRKAMIQSLNSVLASEFSIAGVTLRLTIVPVMVEQKNTAFVVEFVDRTQRILLERKITDALTNLASFEVMNHESEVFLDGSGLTGFFADLVKHINYAMQMHHKALEIAITHQQKSDFLANVSHELRTPLNSINVLSRLLMKNADGNLYQRQVEQLEVIHYAGNDLLNLVNDLLDASKIDAGQMTISLERVELPTLITDLKLMFEPLVKMKGLSFNVTLDEHLVPIESDGSRIRQILKNFLSNALKFTEKGSITLDASCSECGDYTRIQVTDTGIGISPEKLHTIFERFKQADHTTSRKFGGTGLGLSISRDLAHLLGGEIHVESDFGKGSCFSLILHNTEGCSVDSPSYHNADKTILLGARYLATHQKTTNLIDAVSMSDAGELKSNLNVGELMGKSILVVDDNIRNLFSMTALLENTGLPVLTAQNGELAYQLLLDNNKIGFLLTDLMMPEMDGYALMARVRSTPSLSTLPIIAISAQTEDEAKEKSLKAGADAYLTKPVEADALIANIKACISQADADILMEKIESAPPPPIKNGLNSINYIKRYNPTFT